MSDNLASAPGRAPISPTRTLRDACRQTGHDDGGARCPACSLKDLCESEARWLVQLTARSQLA